MTDQTENNTEIQAGENAIVTSDVQAKMDELGIGDWRVGDWLIGSSQGSLHKITGFKLFESKYRHSKVPELYIEYEAYYISGKPYTSSMKPEYFLPSSRQRSYYHFRGDPDTLTQEAFDEMMNPTTDDKPSESVAIVAASGTERMKVIASELEAKATRAMVLRLLVERKLEVLKHQRTRMMRQLHYTMRVINLLETYLGVYEKIITIREGEKAPADTPITIRQLILHMDEEVGSIDIQQDGQMGIDYGNVEKFDEWLLEDQSHVDLVAPELKCVVALRPSRQDRKYSENIYASAAENMLNHYIYLLIRNGDHLFRVWANMKMNGKDRLFPDAATMEALSEALSQENLSEEKELELKGNQLDWQQNAVLLEGLFDRTEVFLPLPTRVSLFEMESYASGRLVLIRDAEREGMLDDGRLHFDDWKKQLNAKIVRGSRILVSGFSWEKGAQEEYFRRDDWKSFPSYPDKGIHVVDDIVVIRDEMIEVNDYEGGSIRGKKIGSHMERRYADRLKVLYMPTDEVIIPDPVYYGWTSKEREKRVAIFFDRSDEKVLNYDLIDLDTVNFYINHRLERRNYQKMLPVLYGIRRMRLDEKAYEAPFVRLIAGELDCDEEIVWEGVNWWKYKTIAKRPISEEEDKAWRMIRGYVKRKLRDEKANN